MMSLYIVLLNWYLCCYESWLSVACLDGDFCLLSRILKLKSSWKQCDNNVTQVACKNSYVIVSFLVQNTRLYTQQQELIHDSIYSQLKQVFFIKHINNLRKHTHD